jgi:hypothetical protein
MARTVYNAPNPFNQDLNTFNNPGFLDVGISGITSISQINGSNDALVLTSGLGGELHIEENSWTIGAKQAGAVVLDAANYIDLTVNGVPVKLLIST